MSRQVSILTFGLILILCTHSWNKGTEDKADFSYHNGNNEPQGFGHIAIAVDDVQACQDRLLKHGVQFKKKLEDGKMRNIAFALDPDGYWM